MTLGQLLFELRATQKGNRRTDRWTDKGKSKCPQPYSGGTNMLKLLLLKGLSCMSPQDARFHKMRDYARCEGTQDIVYSNVVRFSPIPVHVQVLRPNIVSRFLPRESGDFWATWHHASLRVLSDSRDTKRGMILACLVYPCTIILKCCKNYFELKYLVNTNTPTLQLLSQTILFTILYKIDNIFITN
jgi:hypothetical protein